MIEALAKQGPGGVKQKEDGTTKKETNGEAWDNRAMRICFAILWSSDVVENTVRWRQVLPVFDTPEDLSSKLGLHEAITYMS